MDITIELLIKLRKDYLDLATKYIESDYNKRIYNLGKAKAITDLISIINGK